jgi:hypothetical protein
MVQDKVVREAVSEFQWSDWGEQHGRSSREVAVEPSGSERDTNDRPGRRDPNPVGNVAHDQNHRAAPLATSKRRQ